jgi:transposase
MTADTFKYWFLNRFINYLEEGSIIMDNASYHSVTLNKEQNTSAKKKKKDIIDWLEQKRIHFSKTEARAELLKRVLPFRHGTKTYELDQLANERGHHVIRLPPYHCHCNPIELVWAQVKREVAKKNKTFATAEVERLTNEELDRVTRRLGFLRKTCRKIAGGRFCKRNRTGRNFRAHR